ncbi:MAG: DUF2807 domain-containing protein [Myxococcaceae bacterium]|jgi:hypothetical protein|nr:DUF2807 domain-containing protein [Myxococcaceae bacterium]
MSIRLVSLSLLLVLSACGGGLIGSGRRVTESRDVAGFSSLDVQSAIVVTATKGPPALTIEADDNVIGLVRAEVSADRLVIRLSDGVMLFPSTKPIEVRVSNERFEGISASGASQVRFPATRTNTLRLEASGASVLEASEVDADTVLVDLSGASRLTASGRATSMALTLKGTSSAAVRELPVERLTLEVHGASNASATATTVQGALSGASEVDLAGPLSRVDVTTSGASTLRRP